MIGHPEFRKRPTRFTPSDRDTLHLCPNHFDRSMCLCYIWTSGIRAIHDLIVGLTIVENSRTRVEEPEVLKRQPRLSLHANKFGQPRYLQFGGFALQKEMELPRISLPKPFFIAGPYKAPLRHFTRTSSQISQYKAHNSRYLLRLLADLPFTLHST